VSDEQNLRTNSSAIAEDAGVARAPAGRGADVAEPVRYRIDPSAGVVFILLRGDVTFADLCLAQSEILEDPGYRAGMAFYVDCRVVTSIPGAEALRKLAIDRLIRSMSMPVGRLAIVAMTRLGFAFATTIADFLDDRGHEVEVFTTQRAANDWLGLPPELVP
jgi:hypothetical protein